MNTEYDKAGHRQHSRREKHPHIFAIKCKLKLKYLNVILHIQRHFDFYNRYLGTSRWSSEVYINNFVDIGIYKNKFD